MQEDVPNSTEHKSRKEYFKKYVEEHKDKIREYKRKYYNNNKEKYANNNKKQRDKINQQLAEKDEIIKRLLGQSNNNVF